MTILPFDLDLDRAGTPDAPEQHLFDNVRVDVERQSTVLPDTTQPDSAAETVWQDFRHWIDAI